MTYGVPRSAKTRPLTIIAQDPSVLGPDGTPLRTSIDVPAEQLAPGPCGYRVRVVDYDSSTGTLYEPLKEDDNPGSYIDPFEDKGTAELLDTPQFHQQNVYAIAMRVLGRFEFALGRRVSWQFRAHQLKVVPHAFREANAFYSRDQESLLFGYFANPNHKKKDAPKRIYTCLSHDIIAHETTHALLDGVRERFLYPSRPDQAAFHEGFADIVSILSVLSVPALVEAVIPAEKQEQIAICEEDDFQPDSGKSLETLASEIELIAPLVSLAEQMGRGIATNRTEALRDSLRIRPDRTALTRIEFEQPHRRGELLVAAVLRATVKIAKQRALKLGVKAGKKGSNCKIVSPKQMAESFAKSARDMLNICIRGLDYLVPVHVTFHHYLAGILTADLELVGNDSDYGYRAHILESFAEYGIGSIAETSEGVFRTARETRWLRSERTDYQAMMFNHDEMFRYVWENRDPLQISDSYYTRVTAVNPTVRVGPDGMMISETVVEYVQSAALRGDELRKNGLQRPRSMPADAPVELYGGGTLIFDIRGRLKYHIRSHLDDPSLQNKIIDYLWEHGEFRQKPADLDRSRLSFAELHQRRAIGAETLSEHEEEWP